MSCNASEQRVKREFRAMGRAIAAEKRARARLHNLVKSPWRRTGARADSKEMIKAGEALKQAVVVTVHQTKKLLLAEKAWKKCKR